MPTTKRNDPAESLHLALVSFDAKIAELRKTHAQLATLIDQPSASSAVKVAAPRKWRLSAEARAKISATAKTRWAREITAKEKSQKPNKAAKKTQSEAKTSKTPVATAKAKKSPTKKETEKKRGR